MPQVHNHSRTPLGLPDGTLIAPAQTVQVDDKAFKEMLDKSPVVKHWVESKALGEPPKRQEAAKS